MGRNVILIQAAARYRGAQVTVMGIPAAGLIAVTGYNTPRRRTLGLITVCQRRGGTGYRVFGHPDELPDVETAAAVLVAQRTRGRLNEPAGIDARAHRSALGAQSGEAAEGPTARAAAASRTRGARGRWSRG
jgi:hypothetical protein